jgi:hypothetical protein
MQYVLHYWKQARSASAEASRWFYPAACILIHNMWTPVRA